jgi:predicted transcriptional regulator
VSHTQVARQSVGDLVDRLFGGSAESLVMSLVETKHLTPQKLAELQEMVEKAKEVQDAVAD